MSKDKVKYEYKYADSNSERHSVYSWKLVATDKVPEGKQGGASLRDMEKQIQKDLEDNLLIYQTRKMALNSFWDQYIELKKELKESTRTNYIYMYDNYVALTLAKRTSPQSSIVKSRSFIYPLFTKEGSSRTVWR
ncbi:integrase DNA-binding domain-containing protein [[Eubacterium] siraeum]|nr:integrase DNA-binding domain-containing protein [[Eubacterium] siraeum]